MDAMNLPRAEQGAFSWLQISHERCNRCGLCVEMCPMDVLHFGSHGFPYMRYRDDCWYCDVCTFVCPRQAVAMGDLPYLIR